MGAAQQKFGGISTAIPGVYSKSEFPPSQGSVGAATDIVTILGESRGGVPHNASGLKDEERVNQITNFNQALNLLQAGDGLYMTEFFLRPTRDPQLAKPSRVNFVRVNSATQAAATLKDVGTNDIIALKSTRYGTLANQLARKVEAGTVAGTHKVTVKFKGSVVAERDNIGFQYMDIQYVGAGSAATMTINATQLTTSVTGAAGDNLTLLFADFPTLGQLVAYLDEHPAYTCVLRDRSDADTTTFDAVTAADIRTAVYTAVANVEALIQFFNADAGGEFSAALQTSAVRTDVVNDANFVFCAGGTETAATNNDWAAAFELIRKFKANHVLIATGSAAIQRMLRDHVEDMSTITERQNRSGGCGASTATSTKAARIAEAKAINSPRIEYHVTPFVRADIQNGNQPKTFAPFFAAAIAAGIRFGNFITMAATFKTADVLGVTENYDRPTKEDYIGAGCSMLELTERGISFVRDITTYQGSNLILNTPSMLRDADFITLDIQAKLGKLMAELDRAPDALVIESLKNTVVTNILPQYEIDGYITRDPNTGDPAFSDVEFSVSGDRFDVSFTAILPAPLHFIFVKQKFIIVGFADTAQAA